MNRLWTGRLIAMLCLLACIDLQAASKKAPPSSPRETAPPPQVETLKIAYLSDTPAPPAATPPFFLPQDRETGIQGARLGVADNNTTGQFTRQHYALKEVLLNEGEDVKAAALQLLAEGHRHLLVNLSANAVRDLAALPEAGASMIYDVGSSDDELRGSGCAANVLHLLPSRAMRLDALAQYLARKRWKKLFLVVGPEPADSQYAATVRRAAGRFGLKIVAEKPWQHSFDERRTPESEVPVFTQGADYDVLVVADEAGTFGHLLGYRTWLPRPVVGTQGLSPLAWHYTHEQWGAIQLQNRFKEQAGHWMSETEYAAWLAVRAIGEAATRSKSLQFDTLRDFMRGAEFSLAGFKGVPLSFRPWDGQLRQPVLLAADHSLVAVAPIDGFLHPKTELDTLGFDQPETQCPLKP